MAHPVELPHHIRRNVLSRIHSHAHRRAPFHSRSGLHSARFLHFCAVRCRRLRQSVHDVPGPVRIGVLGSQDDHETVRQVARFLDRRWLAPQLSDVVGMVPEHDWHLEGQPLSEDLHPRLVVQPRQRLQDRHDDAVLLYALHHLLALGWLHVVLRH